VAEQYHDDQGLRWPITVAPYQVQLVLLTGKDKTAEIEPIADQLYRDLQARGVEVLYDDRDESPGVKFNDADLMGMPLRLTVSPRSLKEGGVEFKRRDRPERRIAPLAAIVSQVEAEMAALEEEIARSVVNAPVEAII